MKPKIAVLPGDGVGPEVTRAAPARARGLPARRDAGARVGGAAIDATGDPLPPETVAICRDADAVFLGAVGDPRWEGEAVRPEDGLLRLRRTLGVYANLRPSRYLGLPTPLKEGLARHADVLVVRELSGGVYFGEPRWLKEDEAVDTWRQTAAEVRRVAQVAFRLARRRRKHVTSVDKSNVLACSRLWRRVVTEVAREFPDVDARAPLRRRGEPRAAAGPAPLRRDRHRQPVRRHPERRGGGARRLDRRPALGLARGRPRALRADPRAAQRHRRQGHRQPDRRDPHRRPDARARPAPAADGPGGRGGRRRRRCASCAHPTSAATRRPTR